MSYSPHELLQGRKAAPQARFLGAHPNLVVTFQVLRAMQRQPQEVDCFRALSAALTRVSLREPTELNQLGFGRLKSETELFQPKAQRVLNADGVRSILETDHKVVDIAHQPGFAPQPAPHHPFEPEVEHMMQIKVAQKYADYSPYAKGNLRHLAVGDLWSARSAHCRQLIRLELESS